MHYQESLRRLQAKSQVLRVCFPQLRQVLLLLAEQDFLGCEELIAVVIEEKHVARVKRILDGFVSAVAPVYPIVHIARPRCVLAHLLQVPVHRFLAPLLALLVKVAVVAGSAQNSNLGVKF